MGKKIAATKETAASLEQIGFDSRMTGRRW